jgi:FtsH-binding integral membrane protein
MIYTEYPQAERSSFSMYQVYAWMSAALGLTALVAYSIGHAPHIFKGIFTNPAYLFAIIIVQLGLVVAISFLLHRMSFIMAAALFTVYSLSVGVTMSAIFYVYQEASIYSTFLVTAAMFACMAIYGYFTKADLTSVGSISLMILVGMIFAGLVNLYFQSPAVSYAISAIGVVIFSLLTAYDAQKIKEMSQRFLYDYETSNKIALYGALALYLDFINLFLSLLRFMGQRRND